MLEVKVIASGSKGNCTLVTTSTGVNILLDAGITMRVINNATDFAAIDYALITHEHSDHAHKKTVEALLERGTDVYMTAGTKAKLKVKQRHNLHVIRKDYMYNISGCRFEATGTSHDAAEPVAFRIIENDGEDMLLYLTDSGHIPNWLTNRFTKIMIEANYTKPLLDASDIDFAQSTRIRIGHLSIEDVIKHFQTVEYPCLQEVHLMHISTRHGDGEEFKRRLAEVIDVPIYIH